MYFSWFELAGIPGWDKLYTRAFSVGTFDNVNLFLGANIINKNKNPERHEFILIRANSSTGEFRVVERLRKGKELNGSLGAISIMVLPNNLVNVTLGYDNDPRAYAMYLPKATAIDGNITREGNYNA